MIGIVVSVAANLLPLRPACEPASGGSFPRIGLLMSLNPNSELYRAEIEVVDQPLEVKIPLGAGSITGSVGWQMGFQQKIHVMAKGKEHGTIRNARCDEDGNFCLRYLPRDEYQIYVRDPVAGWCSISDTAVEDNSVDTSPQTLREGGSIRVLVSPATGYDKNVRILATHENGMSVDTILSIGLEQSGCAFTQLWPGEWTITLQRD